MQRRHVVKALAALAIAPLAVHAQQRGKQWRIGFLSSGMKPSAAQPDTNIDAFLSGMRDLGYVEGKNLSVDWRFASGRYASLPALAIELVQTKPDLLVTYGTAPAEALRKVTQTIPIVIAAAIDPVKSGLVASLARPGGNVTGLSAIAIDLSQKHVEMLATIVPKLSRIMVVINPGNSGHATLLKSVQAAAIRYKIAITSTEVATAEDIDKAFAAARRANAGAVLVGGDAMFAGLALPFAAAATKTKMPAIGIYRDHVTAGTLMSYGQNLADSHRRAANYVDKIFKGAKAGDLPVEQPTIIELFINRKTAKSLGLTIPQSLLISADKVLE
ncbi:MAG: ABC transporter substrate-binding protein [Burkholderiales bacterium]